MSWQRKKTENDNADDATVRLSDNVSAYSTNSRKNKMARALQK